MAKTISAHGGMFLFIWIDNIFNTIRIYLRHLYFVVAFGLSYLSLNLYFTLTDKPVYAPITWVSMESYIFLILGALMIIINYNIGYSYYNLYKKSNIKKLFEKIAEDVKEKVDDITPQNEKTKKS